MISQLVCTFSAE